MNSVAAAVGSCPRCGAALESPLACGACHAVLAAPPDASAFALLGMAPSHEIDGADLRRRFLRTSREIHPDFFGTAEPELRERAERNSALLNAAFEIVSDETRRADRLVTLLGGPAEETERAMPQEFLLEVLEWNELLEEARSAERLDPRLAELRDTLAKRRRAELDAVRTLLVPLPAHGAPALRAARSHLNAVRYVDRALAEIESLRLSKPY